MFCFTSGLEKARHNCLLPWLIYVPNMCSASLQPVTNPFSKPRCSFIWLTALLQIEASRSSVFQMAFQWRGVSSSLLAPSLERYPVVCLCSSGMFTVSPVSQALRRIRPFLCSLMRYNLCWFNSSRIAICPLCFSWSLIPFLYCVRSSWQKLRCWHGAKTLINSRNLMWDSHSAQATDFFSISTATVIPFGFSSSATAQEITLVHLLTSLAQALDEETPWHPYFPNNLLAGILLVKLPGVRYMEQPCWKYPDSCLDHRPIILKISIPKKYS